MDAADIINIGGIDSGHYSQDLANPLVDGDIDHTGILAWANHLALS